jgi:trans-aconitate methyltransferase
MAEAGAEVVGIDLSPDMVAGAKAKGVDARVGDGQHLHFHNEFDAVVSNAALHWMTENPQAVIEGVYRALKPGGRFVAEMGGRGNISHIIEAFKHVLHHAGLEAEIENVWYFPSPDEYRARLEREGFMVETIELLERPTPLATGIEPWVKLFGRPLLQRLPKPSQQAAITQVANTLEPHLKTKDGSWVADYVRLRFAAVKPT